MIVSRVLSVGLILAALAPPVSPASKKHGGKRAASAAAPCEAAGALVALPGLPEASGLALSRRTPGLLWSHNDQGPPMVVALDTAGAIKGRVRITGAAVEDWEDVEVGACPAGSCLYVGDIGDNFARRPRITVYRVPEPLASDSATPPAEALHATYPDRPQDAEALLVTAKGELLVATKGESAASALYRFPMPLRPGATVTLERVAALEVEPSGTKGNTRRRERITDGAVSPDGHWAALRTHRAVLFYRPSDLAAGNPHEAFRVDLSFLREPQGEGLAIDSEGAVYLCGEGGAKRGTFARLTCTFPR
jgi:hypothetical protein